MPEVTFEGHWQEMYDSAAGIFWIAGLAVAGSLAVLAPYPPAWGLAALAGASWALYPVLRRLMPRPRKYAATLGNLLQGIAWIAAVLLVPRAHELHSEHLGKEAAIDGWTWLVMLLHIGVAALTMSALLLLAIWRWPERYARDRMSANDNWDEA